MNPRATRRRVRKAAAFTPAELEWLTGERQDDANEFARLQFDYPAEPRDFDAFDALLDRAEPLAIVNLERLAELRNHVAEIRAADRRRFPRRAEYIGERIWS